MIVMMVSLVLSVLALIKARPGGMESASIDAALSRPCLRGAIQPLYWLVPGDVYRHRWSDDAGIDTSAYLRLCAATQRFVKPTRPGHALG